MQPNSGHMLKFPQNLAPVIQTKKQHEENSKSLHKQLEPRPDFPKTALT